MQVPIARRGLFKRSPRPVQREGIFKNSFWYGLELGLGVVCGALLSVAVARALGPEQLGHFVFLAFVTGIANRFADLGTAAAARKYIAEYLSLGQFALARKVFFTTLQMQALLSAVVLAIGISLAVFFVEPQYRLTVCILVASIAPALLASVPSQTNLAIANFSRNFPGAMAGLATYAVVTLLTLFCGWGLPGLAAAVFLRRMVEMVVRMIPAVSWMASLPGTTSEEFSYRKVITFSGHALAISALLMIVNDRSEILFLKHFCDVKQVAFYSIAFGLSEYLLSIPQVFAGPIASEFMFDHARNQERAGERAARALRLLCMVVIPVQLGLAALSSALVALAYGRAYLPSIPAVAIVSILAIPKAFFWMPSTIYRTTDRQASQLRYLMVAAVLNIALDAILIPRFGSVGAAVANGISQGFAVASMWGLAAQLGHLRMRWPIIARIAGAAVAMSLLVAVLCLLLHPPMALLVGTVVGVLSYIFFLRLFNAVRKSDVSAMSGLGERMQPRLRAIFAAILVSVISGDVADTEVPDEKLSTAQIDLCETPGSEDAKCEKPKAASLPCA